MRLLLKLVINALLILAMSQWFGGIEVKNFVTAIGVAIVLSILNVLVKPLLIIITIPVTVLTLGLFLIVINAFMVILASSLIPGFTVFGWWPAILFSLVISFMNGLLEHKSKGENKKDR